MGLGWWPDFVRPDVTSSAVENYLKRIYLDQTHPDNAAGMVSTGRLALSMGVTPGTATSMLKTLAAAGLVEHESRRGAKLTAQGMELALHVLRRHRLLELFLVETLGLDWTVVHEEAERLEHAVSDRVLERIDHLLGNPLVDPHGDPIPQCGTVDHDENPARTTLLDCDMNVELSIVRVMDQNPDFLRLITAEGLVPGQKVTVANRDFQRETMTLAKQGDSSTLGLSLAHKIIVQ